MTGVWVLVAVVVLTTVAGLWYRRVNGRITDAAPAPPLGIVASSPDDPPAEIEADAGVAVSGPLAEVLDGRLGEKATMVQFSSAFCQPCRATRRILEEVTVLVPGVSHVEIDAEDNLDLVRELDIRRTPTVLFVDSRGVVRKHASGQPRKADVIAALGEIVPGGSPDFVI
jgi:thiol-disulfide isomerase/thioredoxin